MDNSIKNILALGGIVTLTSVGLFFFGKAIISGVRRRQQGRTEEGLLGSLSEGSSAQEQLEQEQAKSYDPKTDAKAIRGYLDGNNFYEYSEEIMKIFNKLSNAKLKKLADHYKKTYKISLYKQMDEEWDLCGWTKQSNCYTIPMGRLSNLNLR